MSKSDIEDVLTDIIKIRPVSRPQAERALTELHNLEALKQMATEFEVFSRVYQDGMCFGEIRIKRREQRDGSMKWAVYQQDSFVLNKQGEWEYEPIPSNRDDGYIANTRFDSLDAAWRAAEKAWSELPIREEVE